MTEKLLPCPFCGGEAQEDNSDYADWMWFRCTGCNAKSYGDFHCNREEAIAQWNKRPVPRVGSILRKA